MNRLLVLLLATASIAASGCFGVPEGAATNGSLVTIDFVARDAETGEELLAREGYRFVVGDGASGLGDDLEAGVRGHVTNDTFTVRSVDDDSRDFSEEVRRPRMLGSDPAEGEIPVAAFQQQFQREPEVNETFEFNAFYEARVVSVGQQNFTYRFVLDGEEERIEIRAVGVELVSTIEFVEVEQEDGSTAMEERLVRRLAPLEGATFTIQPPTPQNPEPPLGLEPGTYRTVGMEGDDLVYERAAVAFPMLAGVDVEFEVTLVEVVRDEAAQGEMEGDYGVRGGSPYVNGDPRGVDVHRHDDHDEVVDDGHADDGHNDHTH